MLKFLKNIFISGPLLYSVIIVPLPKKDFFKSIHFKGIPATVVTHSTKGLTFKVDSSSSAYLYPFSKIKEISSINVEGHVVGKLNLKGETQGVDKGDDHLFKVGLIIAGEGKLNFAQRLIAPNWVLDMEKMLPDDIGVERVEFFMLTSDRKVFNTKRVHPLSDLFVENRVWLRSPGQQKFSLSHSLDKKLKVIGLWMAADGDNSKSKFTVDISKIEFNNEKKDK